MKAVENAKTSKGKLWVSSLIAIVLSSAYASTFNVPSGTTTTTNSLAETDRTYKRGDGTLVVNGTSTFKTMTVEAGTLKFSGGTATIADSTATGAYGTAMFVQSGGNTIIADGATVTAKDGTFVDVNNGMFIVTNATFDASGIKGDMMNAFSGNNSDCWIVIETNGVLKTTNLRPTGIDNSAMKERVGVRLNRGGKLYLTQFWIDGKSSNGSIANRYGRVLFDGGILYPSGSQLFQASQNLPFEAYGYINDQMTPTILEGGCYIHTGDNLWVYPSFSGIPGGGQDGGLHHSGSGVLYWRTGKWRPSTYNGGTWLESDNGGVFSLSGDNNGDDALGVVPATPSTNIWLMGSNHTLFNEGAVDVHANRMIFIKDGRRLYAGSQGRIAIHGEIHGEITAGNTTPLGTALHVKNGGTWNGTVALDPGAGHTNDIGRLINYGRLEVTSGVTRVVAVDGGTGEGSAMVFINGNNSAFNGNFGHLVVNGGTLVTVPQASGDRFLIARQYAHTEITNGGKIDMPKACYVNGLSSPASLTIADGGELKVRTFQFANSTMGSTINLASGGMIVANEFWAHAAGGCTVNLDGGGFGRQGTETDIYFGSVNSTLANVTRFANVKLYAKEGGALVDVAEKNIWWRAPIMSGAANDGGLRKTGAGVLVVCTNFTYNGSTTVAGGTMQLRYQNALPQTTLKLENGAIAAFSMYDSSNWENYTHTEQTFKRIEGNGRINYSKNVHVTESIAPSVNGQIYFEWACDLNGDLEIEGDANGCGRIAWPRFTMDLSKLTLKVKDFSKFDPEKAKRDPSTGTGYYRILECPANLYSGKFNLPADWPSNWAVVYAPNGAYLKYQKGLWLIIR